MNKPNSMSELTNNLNYVTSNNVKSNNVPNNVSNVTNNGGQFAMMDIEEKFIKDYNQLLVIDEEMNGFKHAFYEFYQNFIDVKKLKKVCKHLKNKRRIVKDFFLKIESLLFNIYFNRKKLTNDQEVSDYISKQRKYALNAINKFEFNTIPRGGKRKQTKRKQTKKKTKQKRKQKKQKRINLKIFS